MDDFLQIGPKQELEKIQEQIKDQMLLRDIVFLDAPGDTVQFLGWQISRTAQGFDVAVNEQLARDIVADAGVEQSARPTHVPGMKDRVTDETPCTPTEHRYYRTQVGRLLFYSVLRPDLQFATTQLSKHVHAPTAGNLVMLKRAIRYLRSPRTWSCTCARLDSARASRRRRTATGLAATTAARRQAA
jgi:hypothetical protein